MEKRPREKVITKKYKENPAVTAILLNLEDDNSNSDRINECY
jgi:hypothetical protein